MANQAPTEYVPTNAEHWNNLATQRGLHLRTLKSLQKLQSGSQASMEQYILFRVVCSRPKFNFHPERFGLGAFMQQTAQAIASPEIQKYLTMLRAKLPYGAALDTWANNTLFKLAYRNQSELAHKIMSGQKWGESVVNAALITFLQSIAELLPGVQKQWSADRTALTARFGKVRGGNERQYVAITDGKLMDWGDVMRGLVECKRLGRDYSPHVEMQEVAELVAWVKEQPDPAGNLRAW